MAGEYDRAFAEEIAALTRRVDALEREMAEVRELLAAHSQRNGRRPAPADEPSVRTFDDATAPFPPSDGARRFLRGDD